MKRKILGVDTALVEKYSDDEMLVLCGGIASQEAMAFLSIHLYCPIHNRENCRCNVGCK